MTLFSTAVKSLGTSKAKSALVGIATPQIRRPGKRIKEKG